MLKIGSLALRANGPAQLRVLKDKAKYMSFRLGLHSGLRQSGRRAFFLQRRRRAEARLYLEAQRMQSGTTAKGARTFCRRLFQHPLKPMYIQPFAGGLKPSSPTVKQVDGLLHRPLKQCHQAKPSTSASFYLQHLLFGHRVLLL